MKLVYMAHPFGGDPANLERAKRWLKWLSRTFADHFFVAPWIPLCEVLNDACSLERTRMLHGDCLVAGECDKIVAVGGRISKGMELEIEFHGRHRHRPCFIDLTDLGPEPPKHTTLRVIDEFSKRG